MSRLARSLSALGLALFAAGCPSTPELPEPGKINLTASAQSVRADGTTSVILTIQGANTQEIKLAAARGTFKGGTTAVATIPGGAGTAELVTCDSRTVPGCAGSIRVGATSGDGASGAIFVEFIQLEVCGNAKDDDGDGALDCADPECLNLECALPSGGVGVGVCNASGDCLCSTGVTEQCDDGKDNNCDGKSDCADVTCGAKACKLPSGFDGQCAGGTCKCPATVETCSNGIDDDCDGQIDCLDANCQATAGNLGKVCDTQSHTCSAADSAGAATCTVCPGGQSAETTCNDTLDNDCDGLIDCADSDCGTQACAANGKVCDAAQSLCVCSGNGGTAELTEASCNDGKDNDCDGLVDCADTNCRPATAGGQGGVCGVGNGNRCTATGACACSGNGGAVQTAEAACNDGFDNDCDGLADCADPTCQPVGNALGKVCDLKGNTCSNLVSGTSSCNVCSGNGGAVQATEFSCGDGFDNDCDGVKDCQDPSCDTLVCSTFGQRCGSLVCACQGAEALGEVSCGDGQDNDCDGKLDCADPDCQPINGNPARACSTTGKLCTAGGVCACTGNGGTVEATELTCSDGKDNDCDGRSDCMDSNCQASGGALGKSCDTLNHTCTAADGSGNGTCTYCPGGQTAEVSCADNADNDCDGLKDCADSDCDTVSCAANGKVCQLSQQLCICGGNGAAPEAIEVTCGDAKDNDCDGKVDCADTDCLAAGGQQCGTFGKRCLALNTCGCGAIQEDCVTPADDDCDGLVNCEETFCRPGTTGLGKICDLSGTTCSQVLSGVSSCSVCSGNGGVAESAEGITGGAAMTCGDKKDNDCDGTAVAPSTDCQDSDCNTKPCNNFGGVCSFAQKLCVCPSGQAVETALCNDGLDNDCDGLTDCADPDCKPVGTTPGGSCGAGNGFLCTGTGTCVCSGNGGAFQATETTCSDGKDNDCDGTADCADTNCRPVGNALGKVCDALGNTCSNPVATVSSCNVCSGNGGPVQAAEFSCGDAKDNDCDGLIDCQDTGCDTLACDSTGKRCVGATLTCACQGPEALGETSCGDGQDNDCDGKIDCADSNCQPVGGNPAAVCSTTGHLCTLAGACACSGNGGVAEASELTCGDGKDNDCDGLIDCTDANCRPVAPATTGRNCSQPAATPPTVGMFCDSTSQCICPGGQATEASCADGLDNDCDGLTDCADPHCLTFSCSATGKTCASTGVTGCQCPSGLTVEANCSNGTDDDCDGLADCDDGDCVNKVCNTLNANYECSPATPSVCKDKTSTFTLVVTTAKARIPADGVATTVISATVKNGTAAVIGGTVTFAVTAGPGAVSPLTAVTDSTGKATTVFTADTTGGTSTITATYGAVSGFVKVEQPVLAQVNFVSQQYTIMGVRYSGFNETNTLTFQVLDTAAATYPAGLSVTFSHSPVGGSYLGSTPNCTLTNCTATGVTNGTGMVTVLLRSGTVASVVSVGAEATAGGATATASASNIAIVGAKASGTHVSLDCTPKNTPAFNNTDCNNSFVPVAPVVCRAAFADRFNNVLGVPTLVTFTTEAGAASPPATTPTYNPAQPPSGQVGLGVANGYVAVNGFSLPLDVAPRGSEYSLSYTDACGTKVHNPRDGLVSIIVSAVGEEGFLDGSNGRPANGIYDLGEYFVDQGEPFVDKNDNGQFDPGEPFVPFNNNGVWDGPNGIWDENSLIWAETRILYSGSSVQVLSPSGDELSRWYGLAEVVPTFGATVPPTFLLTKGMTPADNQSFRVYFGDLNFNQPHFQTTYTLTNNGPVTSVFTSSPVLTVDSLGMAFTQQFCDAAPPLTGNCANACQASPCYLVSGISNYSYGTNGVVKITAGNAIGPAEVRVNATRSGITLPVTIFGNVQ